MISMKEEKQKYKAENVFRLQIRVARFRSSAAADLLFLVLENANLFETEIVDYAGFILGELDLV